MSASLNRKVLGVFGPVLILTGVGGFLLPPSLGLMSQAAPYNVFHIVFGCLGAALALRGVEGEIAAFNIGFGLIDLYQAVAHWTHLFPEQYFRWTAADDVLHVVLGLGLAAVGGLALKRPSS